MTMERVGTGDIGGRLRHTREQRGLSLRDVARRTKLSLAVLQALERNDFESLPAGIYRKAYLRTLAREVGLDPDLMAADFGKPFEPAIKPATAAERQTVVEEKWARQLEPPRRSIGTLAALAALAAAWFAIRPSQVKPIDPAQEAAGGLIAARAPLEHSRSIPIGSTRVTAEPLATPQQAEVPLRIEMAATGWCWVAAEADGERVMYRLMEPGERIVLEGQRMISLRLGDAGSMTLSINDGEGRSIGRDGEVVELELTPDDVESVRDGAAS